MKIKLRLFAVARDLLGSDQMEMELDEGSTVEDLKVALAGRAESLEQVVQHCMFAIDDDYVAADTPLNDGTEVAVIPPVSGG